MVEKVLQHEEEKGEKNVLFRLPKHIKQFGSGGNAPEIYIEDYAQGYLSRLAANDCSVCRVAVLVGEFIKSEDKRYVFIRGAIEAENAVEDNVPKFSSEIWAGVYAKIKRFFPQYEAVGWFFCGPEFLTAGNDTVLQTHLDWFGGRDRVLYRIDPVEKEAAFYVYEKGELVKWPGYAVYYEKNEEMQDFLVAGKPQSVDAGYTEPVLIRLGQRLGRKTEEDPPETDTAANTGTAKNPGTGKPETDAARPEPEKEGTQNNKEGRGRTGAGMVAAAALLVVVAAALRYSKGRTNPASVPTAGLVPTQVTRPAVQETVGKPTKEPTAGPEDTPSLFGGDFDKFFHSQDEPPLPTQGISMTGNPENTKVVTPEATKAAAQTPKPTQGTKVPVTDMPEPTGAGKPTTAPTQVPVATKAPTKIAEREPTKAAEKEPGKGQEDKKTDMDAGVLYRVKSGDTLAAICRSFYGSVARLEEVKEVNQIPDENKIYAGQELFLPK